jgi:hypothetical protein
MLNAFGALAAVADLTSEYVALAAGAGAVLLL